MKCKCVETDHSHHGYCNLEITFDDSTPMNYYKEEKVYGKDSKGERIVIDRKTIDYEKERCCHDCYDKIKIKAISQFKKHEAEKPKMDKEIKNHPLGAGFISKDMKMKLKKAFQGCEICGESVKSKKRNDDIHVCDSCNDKYPIKD